MPYIDLTQIFKADMPVFPGDSKPELKQTAHIDSDGATNHEIRTGMHVGTHMDAPWHMIANAKMISEIDPERFFGRGVLIDARDKEKIDLELLENVEIKEGDIVLILTGWSHKFHGEGYYENYPVLTENLAQKLVELKVKIVGTDTPSPDSAPYSVHKILLGSEILILENLTNLEKLINQQFEVVALPVKLETDAAPVRVIAKI